MVVVVVRRCSLLSEEVHHVRGVQAAELVETRQPEGLGGGVGCVPNREAAESAGRGIDVSLARGVCGPSEGGPVGDEAVFPFAEEFFFVSSCALLCSPVLPSAAQCPPVLKSPCDYVGYALFKVKCFGHTPPSMGNSLGRRAQTRIDQVSLWDDAFDESSSAPATVEPGAEALPDGAFLVAVAEEAEPDVVDHRKSAVVHLPRSHCPAGHPYDADNTYVSRQGWRSCRTCKRFSDRRRRARTAKNLTPEERTLRARMGAYRLHALYDPRETTKKARVAFAARFDRQVDPDGVLPPAERVRRADAARRAYFTELQLRSSRSRRRR